MKPNTKRQREVKKTIRGMADSLLDPKFEAFVIPMVELADKYGPDEVLRTARLIGSIINISREAGGKNHLAVAVAVFEAIPAADRGMPVKDFKIVAQAMLKSVGMK